MALSSKTLLGNEAAPSGCHCAIMVAANGFEASVERSKVARLDVIELTFVPPGFAG